MSYATFMAASRRPRPTQEEIDEYRAWRLNLARNRLQIAGYFCIAGNFAFAALDLLVAGPSLVQFLWLRTFMQAVSIVGLLLNRGSPTEQRQRAIFLLLVLGLCCPISIMTALTEGFRSSYYSGMMLILFGVAVLVPVRWRWHAIGQIGALTFYVAVNAAVFPPGDSVVPAIASFYFLFWTAALATTSVMLYERLLRDEFRARKQLQLSNEKLLELDKLKSQFFANISHELRTPLTLVIGAFRNLARSLLSADALATAGSGLRNAVGLLYLINELLDLARFDSGRAELKPRPVDFAALVRQIAANFEHSVRQRIHLQGISQPLVVQGDPVQLKKIVYNLLSNAVKFSDPESGEVWLRLRKTERSLDLEVEDNGIGMAPQDLTRIFDRFTQVEGSAARRYEGSGIGLALVKEIVAQHGGTIEAESRLGQGSTFRVSLPKPERELSAEPLEDDDLLLPSGVGARSASQEGLEQPAESGALILIADDNPDMRQYLDVVLAPHFRVLAAADGREALEKAKARKPDLIITDIMMPHMSGPDLLAKLREEKELRDVPVVFLSALSASDSRLTALKTGVDDLISKPFDEDELVMRLRNILAARKQQREMADLRLNALRRFLPAQVAATMIERGTDTTLQSHRTEVTVVFFDLRGFTAFSEEAEPEELMQVLRDYQAKIGRLVDAYGGTLERFTGDSIMVFFNDPLSVPDHPQRAIRMAIEACELLPGLEDQWRKLGFSLGVGVGAATGYATLGMVGYERRQDYAAIGPVTNLAARLCARAESGQILVPERLAHLLQDVAELSPIGPLKLRGFKSPVNAYNVAALRSSST
jgi:signal transduction histidine kinase/class 3 adenylate cyclase